MSGKLKVYDKRYLNWWERLVVRSLRKKWWKKMDQGLYTEAHRAHVKAEKIRARHGYSGGWDGDEFIPNENHPWLI